MMRTFAITCLLTFPLWLTAQSWVQGVSPSPNKITVASQWNLTAIFSQDIDPATLTAGSAVAYGYQSGYDDQVGLSYDAAQKALTLTASRAFLAGEKVSICLTEAIQNTGGAQMPHPYCWEFTIRTSQSNGQLTQSRTEQVGAVPYSLAFLDADGDGDLDIATGNRGSNNITLLVNDGMGDFTLSTKRTSVGNFPEFIIAGDWDHDGDFDLATANAGPGTVSILMNDGTGAFSISGTVPVGLAPHTLNTSDLDGDGDLELVASNFNSNTLSVLTNNGIGSFSVLTSPNVGQGPEQAQIGDWDGDGDRDMAVSNYSSGNVSVLENTGTSWSAAGTINTGDLPHLPSVGDLDGDGDLDLLAPSVNFNRVYLLFNNGSGTFFPAFAPVVGGPWAVTTGDFHGDGLLDFGVVLRNTQEVSIFENSGGSNFKFANSYLTGNSPHQLLAADLNGDEALDLAVANDGASSVTILMNTPTVGLADGALQLFDLQLMQRQEGPTVFIGLERPTLLRLKVVDLRGVVVFRLDQQLHEGAHYFPLSSNMSTGLYTYQVEAFGTKRAGKWLVLK